MEEKKCLIIFYTGTLQWANQQFRSVFNEHCEILSEMQKLLEACFWIIAISRIIDQWTEAERAFIQREEQIDHSKVQGRNLFCCTVHICWGT